MVVGDFVRLMYSGVVGDVATLVYLQVVYDIERLVYLSSQEVEVGFPSVVYSSLQQCRKSDLLTAEDLDLASAGHLKSQLVVNLAAVACPKVGLLVKTVSDVVLAVEALQKSYC